MRFLLYDDTLGTNAIFPSFGIEEMMTTTNQAQIDVRVKQAIWKREMDSRDSIHQVRSNTTKVPIIGRTA